MRYENEEINCPFLRATYDPCCCVGLCWAYLVLRERGSRSYNFRNIDASEALLIAETDHWHQEHERQHG